MYVVQAVLAAQDKGSNRISCEEGGRVLGCSKI